jgi:hypothetical protein
MQLQSDLIFRIINLSSRNCEEKDLLQLIKVRHCFVCREPAPRTGIVVVLHEGILNNMNSD